MLFNSAEFIFLFLPAAVLMHFLLARWKWELAILGTTLFSLAFYAWWNTPLVLFPIVSILANFWIARLIVSHEKAKARRLLICGIAANVLVLCYWKYSFSFIPSIAPPVVPLALSFTTFVQIAFLVDMHRRRTQIDLNRYALFVTFFPHLIAGPIVRWNSFGRQLGDASRGWPDWSNIALGLTIFVLGLGKKVLVADTLSPHVTAVFDAAAKGEPIAALAAWGAALGFSAQIFFDFSGYSEMAIGLGLLFNFRLPINFAAPLRATNVIDFWRRWHISLSQWLRDYVYGPLTFGRPMAWWRAIAVMITMLLCGVWHGVGWTFAVWGAYQGALLVINAVWQGFTKRRENATRAGQLAAGWLLTFTAFVMGAVFFRAANLDASWHLLKAMSGFSDAAIPETLTLRHDLWAINHGWVSESFVRTWFGGTWSVTASVWTAGALAIALFAPDTMEITGYREGDAQSHWRRDVGPLAWRPSLGAAAAVFLIFTLVFYQLNRPTEFLYFQF
ncbi:MAG: hypothetical protein K0Q64_1303 [Nitrobacter vulgaris]|jgi:D-alanyl-lipoteichoic acid acyltransferase DltB (MBOAT superfamily)|nr:hypothetical protein [Nitrobacter vulgaris]